jgi:hypothetical protein
MNISRLLSIAGLTLTIGALAPCAFAQGGAAVNQAPSLGQPGTQAPASAAPIGSASSDYMSHEGNPHMQEPTPASTRNEIQARETETAVEREIVAAKAHGVNVATAERQKWLGSIALSKGDRTAAMSHFNRAKVDLRKAGYRVGRNNVQLNDNRTNLNANETDQTPNATNMHPNSGAEGAY